jgi:hypothetical protein
MISRDSDWLLDGRPKCRSSSPGRVKNFYFSMSSTQPPIQRVPGELSQVVKRLGREGDHSPPVSAEVKKIWISTSIPHTPSWCSA